MSKRPPSTSPPTARKRQTSTASSRASTQPPKADVDRSNLQAALHSSRASTCSSLASSLSSTISSSSSAAEPTSQSEGKLHRKTEEFSLPRIAGSAAQSPSTQRQSSSSTEPYTENVQKSKEPQRGPAEILSTTAAEERDIQLSLQSENGTRVPSSVPATINSISSSLSLATCNGHDSFPLFRNGNVIILSNLDSYCVKFQLHSFILMQHSAWFRDNLNINPDVSNPIWYAYSIERNANGARLARRDVQGNCPLIQNQKLDSNAQPIVKLEHCHVGELSDNADQAMVQCERPIASTELPNDLSDVGFYQKVFAAFYNIRPQLCQTDIGVTLIQAEGLAKIAGELGCLHLIRADISFALSQYGKKLFVNIRFDPPRWICLGMALEDSLIYKEALIHIVGAHPRWPWRRSERSMLPPELHTLIAMKSKILDQMCLEADRDLMLLTIEVGGHPVSFNNGKTMETWLLVQIFRDQLAALLRSQRGSDDWALKRGKLYRKFHKGGSAYMDYENVQRQCKRLFGLADWSELGDDLKNLKQYASAIVERLAKNELMLDLEEPSKIGYLTCVDIQKEDIPFPSSV